MNKHIVGVLFSMALAVGCPVAKAQGVTGNERPFFDALNDSEFAEKILGADVPAPYREHAKGVFYEFNLWGSGATVRVCFLDGSSRERARVAQVASEWTHYGNLKFDFGDVGNPKTCKTIADGDIKIAFRASADTSNGGGHWSWVGTQSRDHYPSMMLENLDAEPPHYDDKQWRRFALHEFGHAIGLEHEHQSPEAHCDNEIDWPAAYKYYREHDDWDEQKVHDNLVALTTEPRPRATPYDRLSIMHYALPSVIFTNGTANKCFAPLNYQISETDKLAVREAYSTDQARALRTNRLLTQLDDILKRAKVPDLERARIIGGTRAKYAGD